ncbi:hypothetical protein GIB67_002549 [Kingdonia uniflora]|uniref:Golgin candidate 2 n=1 Tax=Kingdonia uniflora TaxID=39325 RepID=A0A7J7N940_9MAGN|nr:hypothetical protein GIB67_002549 [Kingdonia uniflora]
MSGWISSKLKVAETFLQQIDQQAAESLKKNEKLRSDGDNVELNYGNPIKNNDSIVVTPLKDQFKKRTSEPPLRRIESGAPASPLPSLTDSDWTHLLATPKNLVPSGSRGNGVSSIRGLGKTGAKKVVKGRRNSGVVLNSSATGTGSRVENNVSEVRGSDIGEELSSGDSLAMNLGVSDGQKSSGREEGVLESTIENPSNVGATLATAKMLGADDCSGLRVDESSDTAIGSSVPQNSLHNRKSLPSLSSSSSSSSGGSSASDSERENERKVERARRRDKINAEKAAKAAVDAIEERENIVARLEGEKQSLEKILVERAEQQAQEASELQMTMMETMEAVELEKQKHSNTRMEALSRLAKLETANADLAKSLATTQWNLEIEANSVADLRHQIELKEAAKEELRRRMSKTHQNGCGSSREQFEASKGVEFEREILETEYSFAADKMKQLQEKEIMLEENIEIMRKEIETPIEIEVELKKRLTQLTDHLIQKQSQVESLSSEKATLLFRIETVSACLDEQRSTLQLSDSAGPYCKDDIETGTWKSSKSKRALLLADRIQSGGQHLGSMLRQLDAIFSAGAAIIRRNASVKWSSLFYIICLHVWVAYILMSHSEVSDTTSGAIISLGNINKTVGS